MIDPKAIGQQLAAAVKAQLDPLAARIADLEKRLAEAEAKPSSVDVVNALIDRSGNLVLTMSDGEVKDLGPVVGKDGEPGQDGRDGFGLEDFDASLMEDGRTVLLSFAGKGIDHKVELGFPAMIYRGVFKDGNTYEQGDTVTWAGSLWHCEDETTEKPGEGAKAWTLCAKKGRDGKDGTVKEVSPTQPVRVGVPAGAI